LAKRGFDPVYGARPLNKNKRVIQQELLNKLAKRMIAGDIKPGDRLQVTGNDISLEIEKSS